MKISINGNPEEISQALSINELLAYKKVEQPLMVTVELNGVILQRDNFDTIRIREDDAVEFLYFMGGGAGNLPASSFEARIGDISR
jgi:sulfur carrier protein